LTNLEEIKQGLELGYGPITHSQIQKLVEDFELAKLAIRTALEDTCDKYYENVLKQLEGQ